MVMSTNKVGGRSGPAPLRRHSSGPSIIRMPTGWNERWQAGFHGPLLLYEPGLSNRTKNLPLNPTSCTVFWHEASKKSSGQTCGSTKSLDWTDERFIGREGKDPAAIAPFAEEHPGAIPVSHPI